MHGRRTALRYSPSTPSPAGARSRGQSTVLPFGSGWSAPSPSWRVPGGRCVRVRGAHAIRGLKVPDSSRLSVRLCFGRSGRHFFNENSQQQISADSEI